MKPSRSTWSQADIDLLKSLYPCTSTREIALSIGTSIKRVYAKAHDLGLKKTSAYLSSADSGRILSGAKLGNATTFKKGMTPWNKGMKGLQIGGESTRFKSGESPHNTVPIGSYRVDKDGTLQQKISNESGNNSRRWRSVHELVWTAENGAVPEKHIVVFKKGMRTAILAEITIDKVECISLSENMRRNTRHNLPKELNDLIALRAAVNRQINKRSNP
jgi:hypothetical protein